MLGLMIHASIFTHLDAPENLVNKLTNAKIADLFLSAFSDASLDLFGCDNMQLF